MSKYEWTTINTQWNLLLKFRKFNCKTGYHLIPSHYQQVSQTLKHKTYLLIFRHHNISFSNSPPCVSICDFAGFWELQHSASYQKYRKMKRSLKSPRTRDTVLSTPWYCSMYRLDTIVLGADSSIGTVNTVCSSRIKIPNQSIQLAKSLIPCLGFQGAKRYNLSHFSHRGWS